MPTRRYIGKSGCLTLNFDVAGSHGGRIWHVTCNRKNSCSHATEPSTAIVRPNLVLQSCNRANSCNHATEPSIAIVRPNLVLQSCNRTDSCNHATEPSTTVVQPNELVQPCGRTFFNHDYMRVLCVRDSHRQCHRFILPHLLRGNLWRRRIKSGLER